MAFIYNPASNAGDEASIKDLNLGSTWGSGDLLGARVAVPPKAHKLDLRDGTAATPIKVGVSASYSRVDATSVKELEDAGLGTDPIDGASAARIAIKGTPASQVQITALTTSAWQTGEYAEPFADACPMVMLGRISGGGTGRALASYGEIAIQTTTARGGEVHELRVKNEAKAHSYVSNGPSESMGTWTRAGGTFNSAAAHQIGAGVEGKTFEGGYTVNAGAVSGFGYRDDSSALRSILIKGEHEKAAIAVAAGAGQVVIGAEAPATATPLLEAYSETAKDSIAVFGSDKAVNISTTVAKMSTGTLKAIAVGSANAFMTGTAQGDTGLTFTAGKTFHLGASTKTSQFRMTETGIGFFSTAPVAKPTGVAKTAEGVWTALNTLGLIA
jgi:hypothetical protein